MTTKKKGTCTPVLPKSIAKEYNERLAKQLPSEIKADEPDFVPGYATQHSAWCDLSANLGPDVRGEKKLSIAPGHTEQVDCGFELQTHAGYSLDVRATHAFASRGVCARLDEMETTDGFVRVRVLLSNLGRQIIAIEHKDIVAQMTLMPIWYFSFEQVQA